MPLEANALLFPAAVGYFSFSVKLEKGKRALCFKDFNFHFPTEAIENEKSKIIQRKFAEKCEKKYIIPIPVHIYLIDKCYKHTVRW